MKTYIIKYYNGAEVKIIANNEYDVINIAIKNGFSVRNGYIIDVITLEVELYYD